MALFGSKDKKISSPKTVRPTVIRTQNIAKEIKTIAKNNEVPVEQLDFNLLDTQTYTRMYDGTKETEWEHVNSTELHELDDETALLHPHFQIKQIYEIEIFSLTKENQRVCPNLRLAVGANASKCKVYLSIGAGSKISYKAGLEEDFMVLINKKKIRAGILIYIFDEMLKNVVSKISARTRVEESIVYTKAETILIAEGYEPTPTVNDALILHYEKNSELNENDKIDYALRGFIQSVREEELLIEYMKPKLGIAGRNCRGEFMQPNEPIVSNEITFNVDETIRVVDGEDSIQYFANENGYISFEDNTYTIRTDIDIDEISFKTTGSIQSGVDSDVNISVTEADAIKDAVGSGMNVEVSEIEVNGNVGSNAKVTALKATVGGQTHKTAMIKAAELDINVHKGQAYGKNIKITRLEHGEVEGDSVKISQALGGTVRAKEVDIELCASHVKITASRYIEIQKLQGSENSFTIDPLLSRMDQKGFTENNEMIKKLKSEVRNLMEEVKAHQISIKEGTPAFLEIKKRLVHYKKSGVKLPSSFVKKYKQFTEMQERLKNLQKEYELKNDQLNLYVSKTHTFQDNIYDARVINRDKWVGYNEIKFKLVDPHMELVYKPEEGSKKMIFGLVDLGDGEFKIEAMDE